MTVSQWMTRDPVTMDPDDSIVDALLCMKTGGFRRLPVVELGQVVGIVTDRDLRSAWPSDVPRLATWELYNLVPKIAVREVMRHPVITAHEHDALADAARVMLERRIGGLPVLDANDQLIGVITASDVLRAFVSGSPLPGAQVSSRPADGIA